MGWWLFVDVVWACAGLVHDEVSVAEADAAEVLLEVDGDEVVHHYAVTYSGDAEDFGWIIPVPGDVVSVEDGAPDLFEGLRAVSAPVATVITETASSSGGGGCGGAAKGGDNEALRSGEVDNAVVVAEGFTGTYRYAVLRAAEPEGLSDWFDAEGWPQGALSADLDHYVASGSTFVALSLTNKGSVDGQQLPPLSLRVASAELVYPSVMARHAPVDQRTTVYVQGGSRAELVDGWVHADADELEGPADADPTEVFEAALADLGETGSWLRTWAGDYDGAFVTRFDLSAPPEQHVADAVFGFDGSSTAQRTTLWLEGGSQGALLVPLLLLGGWVRRRGGRVA